MIDRDLVSQDFQSQFSEIFEIKLGSPELNFAAIEAAAGRIKTLLDATAAGVENHLLILRSLKTSFDVAGDATNSAAFEALIRDGDEKLKALREMAKTPVDLMLVTSSQSESWKSNAKIVNNEFTGANGTYINVTAILLVADFVGFVLDPNIFSKVSLALSAYALITQDVLGEKLGQEFQDQLKLGFTKDVGTYSATGNNDLTILSAKPDAPNGSIDLSSANVPFANTVAIFSTNNADTIKTQAVSKKIIYSGGGDDEIFVLAIPGAPAKEFVSIVDAGSGRDKIHGSAGRDSLKGGFSAEADFIEGGLGGDLMFGGGGDDELYGDGKDGSTVKGVKYTDEIHGEDGADMLFGGNGSNILLGGAGDDTITPGSGANQIDGGSDLDTVDYSKSQDGIKVDFNKPEDGKIVVTRGEIKDSLANIERYILTSKDDVFFGSNGDDSVSGGGGRDVMFGADGADILFGGDGNDTIAGGAGADLLLGGAGSDVIFSDGGDDIIDGGPGSDYIEVESTDNVQIIFTKGSGHDVISSLFPVKEAPVCDGCAIFTGTRDYLWYEDSKNITVNFEGLSPSDLELIWDYEFFDNYQHEYKVGQAAIRIIGTEDTLYLGHLQYDEITPSNEGPPRYFLLQYDGLRSEPIPPDQTVVDGASNRVYFPWLDFGGTKMSLPEVFDLRAAPSDPVPASYSAALANHGMGGTSGNDELNGSDEDDILIGGFGRDRLYGGAGNDFIFAGPGSDTVVAGSGAGDDRYSGGQGVDVIEFSSATLGVAVDLASGIASGVQTGEDTLTGFENVLTGAGRDIVTGDGKINRIETGAGADVIYGGDGGDELIGGGGSDVISGGEGFDNLYGDGSSDILNGGAGGDDLFGGTGNDLLIGGDGGDTYVWRAGDGDDTIRDASLDGSFDTLELEGVVIADVSFLRLSGSPDDLIIQFLGGTNLVVEGQFTGNGVGIERFRLDDRSLSATFDLPDLVQDIDVFNIGPTAFADTGFTSDEDQSRVISALALTSNDLDFNGDSLHMVSVQDAVNGTATLNASGDVVFTPDADHNGPASFTYTVSDGEFTSQATVGLTIDPVNDAPVAFHPVGEVVVAAGQTLDFVLPVDAFFDVDGDDLLFSATEAGEIRLPDWLEFDPITGTFTGVAPEDESGTTTIEVSASDGAEAALTSFSLTVDAGDPYTGWTIGTEEPDTIFGIYDVSSQIFGAAGDDVLVGSHFADEIDGGSGDDIIDGGFGDDILNGNGGDDFIASSMGDDLIDGNGGDDRLEGGLGNDMVRGGAGNDELFGNSGDDHLAGGTGNDVIWGNAGSDTFRFQAGDGMDIIMDFNQTGAQDGRDTVLIGVAGLESVDQLMALASQDGADISFAFGGADRLVLANTALASLQSDGFEFI